MSQQYCWHRTIEAEWEDLQRTNSICDIFIHYAHYFQLNLDGTCFICNGGKLIIIVGNDKPLHEKNCSYSRFSTTILWVGSAAGVNGTVIFLAKGIKVHHSMIGKNLVTIYVFPEGSFVITNKPPYMDEKN